MRSGNEGADPFREFELEGWRRVPDAYDAGFGDLTPQAAAPLLDAAGVTRGSRILDIATGPGYVAAAATARGAIAVGIDFSGVMVARARHLHPEIDFRVGDAEELPFSDSTFDAAVMNFGLLHLSRPERAVAEAFRVLRPGGRFAFTVWCEPDEAVAFGIVIRAIEAHGSLDIGLPPGPPFFRFSDPMAAAATLTAAGFHAPGTERIPLLWRLPSPDSLFERMRAATVRTAGLIEAQPPESLGAIRAAVRAEAASYARSGSVDLPMPALLAVAMKP